MDAYIDKLLNEVGLSRGWVQRFDQMIDPITDIQTKLNLFTVKCHELENTIYNLAEITALSIENANEAVAKANQAADKEKGISDGLQAMLTKRKAELDGYDTASLEFYDRLCSNMIHDPVSGMSMMLERVQRLSAINGNRRVYPSIGLRMRGLMSWRLLTGKVKA